MTIGCFYFCIKCDIFYAFNFIYNASFNNGLVENELDHVFIGFSDKIPKPNPSEVVDYRYISINDLLNEIKLRPHLFTPWFKICLNRVLKTKSNLDNKVLIA